jgi:hypothetical protein
MLWYNVGSPKKAGALGLKISRRGGDRKTKHLNSGCEVTFEVFTLAKSKDFFIYL